MKKTHFAAALLLSVALSARGIMYVLIAQPACPAVQEYKVLTGYSVTLDPARISMDRTEPNDPDYALRKPLLLAVYKTPVGKMVTHQGRACEPNSPDPIRVSASNGTLTVLDDAGAAQAVVPVNGKYLLTGSGYYRWTWTPSAIGVTYHWITARDDRTVEGANDERSTTGTIVVVTVGKNKPPILAGGLP